MVRNLPEILTISEAAQYLRISLSSLYKLAQDGRIPAQKVGKHWRFHRQTLINWVAAGSPSTKGRKAQPRNLDLS